MDYLVGRDRAKWVQNLQTFEKVQYSRIYPGVDLVVYGNAESRIEYDLIVAPGADPSRIRIRTEGAIHPRTGDLAQGEFVIANIANPSSCSARSESKGRFASFPEISSDSLLPPTT